MMYDQKHSKSPKRSTKTLQKMHGTAIHPWRSPQPSPEKIPTPRCMVFTTYLMVFAIFSRHTKVNFKPLFAFKTPSFQLLTTLIHSSTTPTHIYSLFSKTSPNPSLFQPSTLPLLLKSNSIIQLSTIFKLHKPSSTPTSTLFSRFQ